MKEEPPSGFDGFFEENLKSEGGKKCSRAIGNWGMGSSGTEKN
jgi:hypothetical protein